jgi:SOS response associated peptidase (SRAP)
MKKTKRCIVITEGFYEWQKKGKDKIPHFIRRKDGQLLLMAGLYDWVRYEDSDTPLYTYTIITTSPNKAMSPIHDRMPAILENGSEEITTWLDPARNSWTKELQSLLRPFPGALDIYPVSKDVGKVGNNSPSFIIPLDSKENKANIQNFFNNAKAKAEEKNGNKDIIKKEEKDFKEHPEVRKDVVTATVDRESTENNAPVPAAESKSSIPVKREADNKDENETATVGKKQRKTADTPASSPVKSPVASARKIRSATSNGSVKRTPTKEDGRSQKITSFFGK